MKNILHSSRENGFTFIELLVVILITGIISVVAYPHLTNLHTNYKLYQEVSHMLMRFQGAQSTAVRNNCAVTLLFETGGAKYIVFEDKNSNKMFDGDDRKLSENFISDDVDMYEARFGSGNRIVFDQRGDSSHLGHVYLKTGSGYRAVVVRSLAGNTVIKRSKDGKSWK